MKNEKEIIKKALDQYCQEVRDPRKGYMITNAADMTSWLMEYAERCKGENCEATDGISHSKECEAHHEACNSAQELFAGTNEALDKLSI